MKQILTILFFGILLVGCETTSDNDDSMDQSSMDEVFEKNSETVAAYLEAWQNKDVDYDKFFAENYESWGTGFGETDSTDLEGMIQWDKDMWETMDFKISNPPVNLLPGVNIDTKKLDGSVRYYAEWEITTAGEDSTELRMGNLKMYQTFVFNDDGKIELALTYGDFTAMMMYLNGMAD